MDRDGPAIELRSSAGTTRPKKTATMTTRAVAPSPVPPYVEPPIGSWLCSAGPYRDYIAALSDSNPSLKRPDPNNELEPLRDDNALVVLLDAPTSGDHIFDYTEFHPATKLADHFQRSKQEHRGLEHDRHRIYIMEGLAPNYVAVLGEHFMMDPILFQRQERTCVWSNDFTPVSDALPQPSLLNPNQSFHLQYCELRQFNRALENRYFFCERTRRHVGMTAARKREVTTVGILRRKISWWCRETTKGGWDVVILCDPQLEHLSPNPKEYDAETETKREIHNVRVTLKNEPFQEGYSDFMPPLRHDRIAGKGRHPHKSMLRDLVYYYRHRSDMLTSTEWQNPSMSGLYLKKIVAAHYLQLVDYIKVMLPSLELRLTTAWVEEQDQWRSLQTISRRCGNYRDDIEDTLLSLGYSLDGKPNNAISHAADQWKDCEKDFQYAYFRLKILKDRADNLGSAMTGLASLAGNRQNLEEAKRVKRLNILALLFIPLAYTSSLFSMQTPYAPNNGEFWVYWVSAIGVVAFTATVTWILDNALDDKAQWTLDPLRYLKFWGKKEIKPGVIKRAQTGFYMTKAKRSTTN